MNVNIRVGGGDIDGCQGNKNQSLKIYNHLCSMYMPQSFSGILVSGICVGKKNSGHEEDPVSSSLYAE